MSKCIQCGAGYEAKRSDSRYCGSTCRVAWHRFHSAVSESGKNPSEAPEIRANTIPAPFSRWGYVYIIKCGEQEIYKIGITRLNPQSRLAALQTGNPYPLTMLWFSPVINAERVEAVLHNLLSHDRMMGEWFKISFGHQSEQVMGFLRSESDYYSTQWALYSSSGLCDVSGLPHWSSTHFDHNEYREDLARSVIQDAIECDILTDDDRLMYGAMALDVDFVRDNPEIMHEIMSKVAIINGQYQPDVRPRRPA